MRKILTSITTTNRTGDTWRNKIKDLQVLGITEAALFVTGLDAEQRKECFRELKKARARHEFTIPFCHAVSSMHEDEFRFLRDHFDTARFNLHPTEEFQLEHPLSDELRSFIYIENSGVADILTKADITGFAGVCLDVSHLFDLKILRPDLTSSMIDFLDQSVIGANHISGASSAPYIGTDGTPQCSTHYISNQCLFDYLERFPARYFSEYCAIEVENSLSQQLAFREQIAGIIAGLEHDLRKAA